MMKEMNSSIKIIIVSCLILALMLPSAASSELILPTDTNQFVIDEAGVLSPADEDLLTIDLRWLADEWGTEIVVVVIESTAHYQSNDDTSEDITNTNLTITLVSPTDINGSALIDVANRTLRFSNDLDDLMTVEATSDENGTINVGLTQGPFTISDESDDDYVLFNSYEVTLDDDAFELSYAIATWANGTIRAVNGTMDYDVWYQDEEQWENNSQPASGLTVNFRSGDLLFTTSTDTNGSYSIRLPAGSEFQMNAMSLFSAMSAGQIVNTVADMDDLGILYLAPTGYVHGQVFLYDNTTLWDSSNPGFEQVTVTATDSSGVEWTTELDAYGKFGLYIQAGLTNVSLPEGKLNSVNIEGFNVVADGDLSMLQLIVNPDNETTNQTMDEPMMELKEFSEALFDDWGVGNQEWQDGILLVLSINQSSDDSNWWFVTGNFWEDYWVFNGIGATSDDSNDAGNWTELLLIITDDLVTAVDEFWIENDGYVYPPEDQSDTGYTDFDDIEWDGEIIPIIVGLAVCGFVLLIIIIRGGRGGGEYGGGGGGYYGGGGGYYGGGGGGYYGGGGGGRAGTTEGETVDRIQ
jgi:hypothetical protein